MMAKSTDLDWNPALSALYAELHPLSHLPKFTCWNPNLSDTSEWDFIWRSGLYRGH